MVDKISRIIMTALNSLLVLTLGLMFTIVLFNVILRYGFNSGITWSEELARFSFVWMIFLGAIVALKEDSHLKVVLLIERFPPAVRKLCAVVVELLMLYLSWLLFEGGWKMTQLNTANISPALGVPMSLLYASTIAASVGMAIVILSRLYKLIFPVREAEQ